MSETEGMPYSILVMGAMGDGTHHVVDRSMRGVLVIDFGRGEYRYANESKVDEGIVGLSDTHARFKDAIEVVSA